jgi:hypothetical protein
MRCWLVGALVLLLVGVLSALVTSSYLTPFYDVESFGQSAQSFFAKHPLTTNVTLSNGEQVAMPYRVYDGRQLLLVAKADAQQAQRFLQPLQLHAAILHGHALALTGIVDYLDCVAGSYSEWFASFIATTTPGMAMIERVCIDATEHSMVVVVVVVVVVDRV